MPTKQEVRQGGGPWSFSLPALDPGEKHMLDFKNMEYNGQKGWFRKWLPLDGAQVVNQDTGNALEVEYNRRFPDFVPPNTVDTFEEQSIVSVTIKNEGSTTIADGDVKVSVWRDPYGADERAREKANGSWLERAADDLIPGGLPGGGL